MNRYVQIIAAREGKTSEEVLRDIQRALELAWSSDDPQHRRAREKLIDSPTAPNPEAFIVAVAKEVQKRRENRK